MTALKPGFHFEMDANVYHADPCPSPSLNQTVAKIILSQSAAHARLVHPRLTPPTPTVERDIGSCYHYLMLGRGREPEVILYDDWRTKDAKASRENAIASGRLPILGRHYETALEMSDSARPQLADRGITLGANSEVVAVARYGDTWLRTMIDNLSANRRIPIDFKTTARNASEERLAVMMYSDGWAVQAAFQERVLDLIDPNNAGRRRHLFVVQENYEPFALNAVELPEVAMTAGRALVAHAERVWAEAMASGRWPAYPPKILRPDYPAWALARMAEAAMEEDAEASASEDDDQ